MPIEHQSCCNVSILLKQFLVLGAVLLTGAASSLQGNEQTNQVAKVSSLPTGLELTNKTTRIRPYVLMQSGEYDTVWGVQDLLGFGVGADLSRHVGFELMFNTYEKDFDPFGTKIGEQSLLTLVPQVRLRLPLVNDRIVPYVIAGAGVGWYDFNDPTQAGYNMEVDAQGTELVVSGGIGVDLFINANVMFNLEWKYLWSQELNVSVDGREGTFSMADFVGTFGFRAYLDDTTKLPLFEAAEDSPIRIYFLAGFGAALITDGNWVPGVSLVQEAASIGTAGESVEIGLGANFGRHLSFEVPMDYYESIIEVNDVEGYNGGVGEYSTYALIPTLRFRYPMMNGKLVPYLMAGLGGVYSEVNDRYANGDGLHITAKGFAPAFSGGGGVEYFFNRDVSLFGQIKYIQSWNNKIEFNNMGEESGTLSWLHFQIGLRLNLLNIGGGK